jgi:hypothetical protein
VNLSENPQSCADDCSQGIETDTLEGTPDLSRQRPSCNCATSLAQVEAAWGLVYDRYTQMDFIPSNESKIHTNCFAVGRHACVIFGPTKPLGSDVGYTMTLFSDTSKGLALDSVYAVELNQLRRSGRRLIEVGLLADRCETPTQGMGAMFGMMQMAVAYAFHTNSTDVIIGVHPRHAPFYKRRYGFEQFAPETTYPMVQHKPVVGLRLPLRETMTKDVIPKGMIDARAHRFKNNDFVHRFDFSPAKMRCSRIANFLKY